MKLCECGCGKEIMKASSRFIRGHNVKINNPSIKGMKFSEEHKRKLGEAQKGRKHTEETKKKISEVKKRIMGSEEMRKRIGESNKRRKVSDETRKKMSEARKGEKAYCWKGGITKKNIALYETYAHQLIPMEEVRRIRFTELGQANLRVRCYHCKKWFIPTRDQVGGRIGSLNLGSDGSHFYCKEECKQSCSIFGQNKFPKGYLPEPNRPDIDPYWRSEVIKRAKGRCERCNEPTSKCGPLIAHHEKPATLFPMLANDIDNGWAVCEQCHYILIHGQEGCGPYELRRIEC